MPKNKTIEPRLGDYVHVSEFACMVGKTRRTMSRWMSFHSLPYIKIGRETHVPVEAARDWLANRVHNSAHLKRKGR